LWWLNQAAVSWCWDQRVSQSPDWGAARRRRTPSALAVTPLERLQTMDARSRSGILESTQGARRRCGGMANVKVAERAKRDAMKVK